MQFFFTHIQRFFTQKQAYMRKKRYLCIGFTDVILQ